jgi:hypothetical protein
VLIDKDLENSPLMVEDSRLTTLDEVRNSMTQRGIKRPLSSSNDTQTQEGESSSSASHKRPRTGDSPILDEVSKISPSNETSMQAGESSNSFKRPRGDSPILDEVYKGGAKPFKKEIVENNLENPKNLEIPSCEPDAPFKTNSWEQIDLPQFLLKVGEYIDRVIPPTKQAVYLAEIDSYISCWLDLNINYSEILYLGVRMLIVVIPYLIIYHPV